MYSAAIKSSSTDADGPRLISTGFSARPTSASSTKFCMLRAPIWITSAVSSTASTWRGSISSVTIGRPVSSFASRRISSASKPMPWKEYGDVRGLKAPPRSQVAPAAATARAVSSVCSRYSTVHGPAISPNQPSPMRRPSTSITVGSGDDLAADQLVRLENRQHLLDPGIALERQQRELLAVADRADHGRLAAALDARLDPVLGEPREHVLGLIGGRRRAHHDQQLGRSGDGHGHNDAYAHLLRHPTHRRHDVRQLQRRLPPVRGDAGARRRVLLHRRPARDHRRLRPGRPARAHARPGRDAVRDRARPRPLDGLRAEPRDRARRGGVAALGGGELRAARPDDAVQGEGRAAGVRLRRRSSPTRC